MEHSALRYGAGELVEALVERGAEVNARLPFFGRVVLRVASREYVRAYRSGATALHYMTNSTTLCPGAVRQLLRFGADPNVAEQHAGATALHYAADAGAIEVVEDLVRHGADANVVVRVAFADPAPATQRHAHVPAPRDGHRKIGLSVHHHVNIIGL